MKKTRTYNLIKSLTTSEKRYFKLFANMQNRSKGNTLLFDSLDKMDVYDEEKLKEKLKGTSVSSNLSTAKKQLFDKLMQALRAYHKSKNPQEEVLLILTNLELLYGKKQYEACRDLIKKGLNITDEYHLFAEELLFIDWTKKRGIVEESNRLSIDHIMQTFNSTKKALLTFNNYNEYWKLANLLYSYTNSYNQTRDKKYKQLIDELMENPYLSSPSKTLSPRVRAYYNNIPLIYSWQFASIEKTFLIVEEGFKHLTKHPFLIHYRIDNFLSKIHNFLIAHWVLGKYKEGYQLIQELEKIETTFYLKFTDHDSYYHFSITSSHKLFFSFRLGIFDNTEELKYIETFLKKNNEKIDIRTRTQVKYSLALYHFIHIEYKKTNLYISEIIQDAAKINKYLETAILARLLNLMMQYELGNHDVGLALLRGQDYYYKEKKKYVFEKVILLFFKKLFQTIKNSKEEHLLFKELEDNINNTFQDRNDIYYSRWLHIDVWVTSKIAKTSLKAFLTKK